jgi:uncharacterized repeat protein (TIGR02543 family)
MLKINIRMMTIIVVITMVVSFMPGGIALADSSFFAGGTGTSGDPYQISTAEQLSNIRHIEDEDVHLILINDIDLSDYIDPDSDLDEGWRPIYIDGGGFSGSLDGNGYKITNLMINRLNVNNIGLFFSTKASSTLTNIKLEHVNVIGNNLTGGLVGYSEGTIYNSYVTGTVSGRETVGGLVGGNGGVIDSSYSSVEVSGDYGVGGLAGRNIYRIYNSYATGKVVGGSEVGGLLGSTVGSSSSTSVDKVQRSYATGDVEGDDRVGGLVGFSHSSAFIESSYATGKVTGLDYVGGLVGFNQTASIQKSYATGNVQGGNYVGGLAGGNSKIIDFSFATGTVEGTNYVGGLIGYNQDTILSNYASGNVKGYDYVGGLTGVNDDSLTAGATEAKIENSYSIGKVEAEIDDNVGGLVGLNGEGIITRGYYNTDHTNQRDTDKGEGLSTDELKDLSIYERTPPFATYVYWRIDPLRNNGYPYVLFFPHINYHGNGHTGGSAPFDSNFYFEGSTANIYGNTGNLVKIGHTFTGWNTKSDGSGTNYSANDTYQFILDFTAPGVPEESLNDITLYAQWAVNPTYTVQYDGNASTGGTVPTGVVSYEENDLITVLGNSGSLVKTGWTFVGWNTEADGSGIDYSATNTFQMGTTNVTLYAAWSLNAPSAPIIHVTPKDGSILVEWNAVDHASSYEIYHSNVAGVYGIANATVGASVYQYEATGVANGVMLYIVVKAVNEGGSSVASGEVSAMPQSENANLSGMTLSKGALNPPFASGTITYTVNLPNSVSSMTLTPTTADSHVTIQVQGTNTASGLASSPIPLAVGDNTIHIEVMAQNGDIQNYTVTVSRAAQQTTIPDEIIAITDEPVSITVPMGITNVAIQATPTVEGLNLVAIVPVIEVQSDTALGLVTMDIPEGTKVTAPAGWDGVIKLPELKSNSSVSVSGGDVSTVIEVGSADYMLIFDRAVRLVIPNQGGKLAGFVRNGVFTSITSTISANTQSAADSEIVAGGEAKITVGNDLVIWTKHLTQFITYSEVVNTGNQGSGGTGGSEGEGTSSPGGGAGGAPAVTDKEQDKNGDEDQLQERAESQSTVAKLSDVEGHWGEGSIRELVKLGAISGYSDSTYRPNNTITRAEFVSIVVKAFKLQSPSSKSFTDMAAHWSKDAIAAAAALGIVGGYDDNTFRPGEPINREQMASIIIRVSKLTAGNPAMRFTDNGDISPWAQEAIEAAVSNNLFAGYDDGTLRPKAYSTRAEAATVIWRALQMMK